MIEVYPFTGSVASASQCAPGAARKHCLRKPWIALLLLCMWLVLSHCGGDDNASNKDQDTQSSFLFGVVSDTHTMADANAPENQIFSYTIQVMNEHKPPIDFVVITGDTVDSLPSDDPGYYDQNVNTALDQLIYLKTELTMPVYLVLGNHDYYTGNCILPIPTRKKEAREHLFMEKVGLPGPYYVFEHRGVKFYCLNSMQKDPMVRWEPNAVGTLGPEQISWLRDQLSDNKPAFFFHHHALATDVTTRAGFARLTPFEIPRADGNFAKYMIGPYHGYTDPVYDILKDHNEQIRAVFFGHSHLFLRDEYEGIPIFMTESTHFPSQAEYDGRPMRYHIVECQAHTGDFTIYNDYMIPYLNESAHTVY